MLSVLIYAILILNDGLFLLFTFLNLVFTVCSSEHHVCPPPSAPRSLRRYRPEPIRDVPASHGGPTGPLPGLINHAALKMTVRSSLNWIHDS